MQSYYLSQDPHTFDQSDDGWRSLDNQNEYLEAAELIEAYLKQNAKLINNQNKVSIQTIHFHAGQEFAMVGQVYYLRAAGHFVQAFKGSREWDVYVAGSIAFLQRDKSKLALCAQELRKAAKNDIRYESNAKLLKSFLEGLESSTTTYAQIYG